MELLKKIVIFSTPEACLSQFLSPMAREAGCAPNELEIGDGDRFISYTDALKRMKRQGLWGFSDINNGIIYAWGRKHKAKLSEVFRFMVHEIYHLACRAIKRDQVEDPEVQEEIDAEFTSDVAELALKYSQHTLKGIKGANKSQEREEIII